MFYPVIPALLFSSHAAVAQCLKSIYAHEKAPMILFSARTVARLSVLLLCFIFAAAGRLPPPRARPCSSTMGGAMPGQFHQ